MAKVFDFTTGLSPDNLLEKFEHFHDWVIQDIKISALKEDMEADAAHHIQYDRIQYDLTLTLRDQYKRFEKNVVALDFFNVEKLHVSGLRYLTSEIMGVTIRRTPSSVIFGDESSESLIIEAEELTFRLL